MSETLENQDPTTAPVIHRRPPRLYRALAWVGIVAGSMFIVATVFFSGYVIGSHSGGGGGHHGRHAMLIPHPPMGPPPPMGPGQPNPPSTPAIPPRP